MALERPNFEVIQKVDDVEIRDYAPYQVASCDVSDIEDLRQASSYGFQYLFNYISGQNAKSQKISMTVPVQQKPSAGGWRISFVVPSDVQNAGAPNPVSSRVEIEDVPGGLIAALSYRGLWNTKKFEELQNQLTSKLGGLGYQPVGEAFSAVYNPPFTPPILRHNEVLIRVKKAASRAK